MLDRLRLMRFWHRVKRDNTRRCASFIFPEDIEKQPDIVYARRGLDLTLDVLYPKGTDTLLPVIMNIHGGGWVSGCKDIEYGFYAPMLAKMGFAVVNINYRLAPKYPFPAALEDIILALEWLKQNGAQYHCDVSKVFLEGDSAGAHLAALTAALSVNPILSEHFGLSCPLKIAAVGLICGVYDFASLVSDDSARTAFKLPTMRALFGRRDFAKSPHFAFSSPKEHMTACFPPCFVSSSEFDGLYVQTRDLCTRLEELSVPHEALIYPLERALPHCFHLTVREDSESYEVLKAKADFFKAQINGGKTNI